MSLTNVQLARQAYEAVARGDLHGLRAFLDPDVKWHGGDPSAAGSCHTREQALQYVRDARLRRSVGELVEVVDAGGDKVVVILRPASGTGTRVGLTANVTTFRDGKAIEIVHYPNPDDALSAAGIKR